jgi:hypothetical protein
MTESPYDHKMITPSVYGDRRPVIGEVVALLHITFEERGLKLIRSLSRAMLRNEIHELMVTEEDASPGGGADHVSAIAFFEVKQGGIAVTGDKVSVGDRTLGTLVGFDMTHMPNHMNVLVKTVSLEPSYIKVGDKIEFSMPR